METRVKTVYSVAVGRRRVVLRSDGNVYVMESESSGGDYEFDRNPKLVATSAAGCDGLAEAFREMAAKIREPK
jgi:hypothetical protein